MLARPADTSEAAAIAEVVADALAMEALTVAIITSESLYQGSLTGQGRVKLVGREGKGFHVRMAVPWGPRLGDRRKHTEG